MDFALTFREPLTRRRLRSQRIPDHSANDPINQLVTPLFQYNPRFLEQHFNASYPRRVDGQWKFLDRKLHVFHIVPLGEGWAGASADQEL